MRFIAGRSEKGPVIELRNGDAMKIKNRAALILGAAKGIGKGIGLALAGQGAKVALNDFGREEDLKILKKDFEKTGREYIILKTDLRKTGKIPAMVKRTIKRFGKGPD